MAPIRRSRSHPRPAGRPSPGLAARLLSLTTAGVVVLAPVVGPIAAAAAQGVTTGSITGQIRDKRNGEALVGVTVAATADRDTVTTITEDDGTFRFSSLVPGRYTVTLYYGDLTASYTGVEVSALGTAQVFHKFDTGAVGAETVDLEGHVQIDPSAKQSLRLRRTERDTLPMLGRSYLAGTTMAAGSHGDGTGPGFSGSSGLENRYLVDGVDTTGLKYGSVGNPLLSEFVDETEVITGGYNAEYGRSTGGVVNVVTRSGTNELEGLVFASLSSGYLTAAAERAARQATSIDVAANLDVAADVGAMISGPVIKDKLWFVLGAAPSYSQTTLARTTKRQVDLDGDGRADVDPVTGFRQFEDIRTREFTPSQRGFQGLLKLNYAASPEHQGQLSVAGGPSASRSYGMYGLPESTTFDNTRMTSDVGLRWTSKFDDNQTELEAVLGWHRDHVGSMNTSVAARSTPLELLRFGNLGEWSRLGFEDEATRLACADGGSDPYPGFTNCPDAGVGYRVGGGGTFVDDTEQRWSARVGVTRRLRAFGTHELKAGLDAELGQLREPRMYTGGVFYENNASSITANRWVQVAPVGADPAMYDRTCTYSTGGDLGDRELPCRFVEPGDPASIVDGETLNWAAFVRDSWQVKPNLIIDAGLRYEEQRLRNASFLRGLDDPNTGRPFGDNALTLKGMWAPRFGAVYDWTREGRSKIYAHWGRFFESVPMDINARSFGGEVSYRQEFGPDDCGPDVEGYGGPSAQGCPDDAPGGTAIGAGGSLVAPGLESQYLDESLAGFEYEVAEGVNFGAYLQHRTLGRVIEDVSTDGAQTYVIANPGEWSADEEARLRRELEEATAAGAADDVARLTRQLDLYTGIRDFDRPRRDHDALTATLSKRFGGSLFLMASYTWSHTRGNYPGLVSYDNGQIDPNISSQYDLIELMSNRSGPLPQERPHNLKVDGSYRYELSRYDGLTLGWRARLASGTPRGALAGHPLYGIGESFLLPRGAMGRTDLEHGVDVHLGYGRRLRGGMQLEVYVDVFNLYDHQGQAAVDDDYTYRSDANPIVGGTYEDLVFAKALSTDGFETPEPVLRNPDFGHTVSRYAPMSARLGARLSF